ncbi:hypothetical protein RFF05_12880 [Bengtsoniella intestinalis]|uniref:hypothetical protein n=1 Tax=Bengtsoniella intestinalis TaxID=3073143 RepID=UPI00391FB46C
MGNLENIWGLAVVMILIVILLNGCLEKLGEGARRKAKKSRFNKNISEEDFAEIVYKVVKRVKRIEYMKVTGELVECRVCSESGLSYWNFMLDFDDRGKITGKYQVTTENHDSNIPNRLGDTIQAQILGA